MTASGGRRGLLAQRAFRRWYLSRALSIAGTTSSAIAMPLLVYQATESAGLSAAIVGLEALPYVLFGLFAGAAADRLRRRVMMVGADICCAAMLATIPIAALLGEVTTWHVFVVAFGLGVGFCWFDAAAWGAATRIVGRDRLPEANSLIWSTMIILQIAAPAAAGTLAAVIDPVIVLCVNIATYLGSAAFLTGIDLEQAQTPSGTPRRGMLPEIGEGIRYLWRQPVIRSLSLAGFGLSMAGGGATALLIAHAHEVIGLPADDSRMGLLFAVGAVGSLIGAVALPRLRRGFGPGPVSMVAYVVVVLALCGFAVADVLAVALVVRVVGELAMMTASTNGITLRQQLTPEDLQGRVNTSGRMLAWGGTPFGAALGGAVAELHGTQVAYLTLAIPAVLGLALLTRSPLWRLRNEPAGA